MCDTISAGRVSVLFPTKHLEWKAAAPCGIVVAVMNTSRRAVLSLPLLLATASKLLFPIPDRGLDERLYRIRAKTMLIWGDGDRVMPPAYGDAFSRGIAGAELVRIPDAGHMVIVERPHAVVGALLQLERS